MFEVNYVSHRTCLDKKQIYLANILNKINFIFYYIIMIYYFRK